MFNSSAGKEDRKAIPVVITLSVGVELQGNLFGGMTGRLADMVNKPEPFLEFAKSSGEVMLLAKSTIASIAPIKPIRVDQLSKRMQEDALPNPHTVLGIKPGATLVEVQNAYHSLARRYHPDHFSGREIPPEVLQYVSAMFQRITAAYNDLKTASEAQQQQQAQPAPRQPGQFGMAAPQPQATSSNAA